MRHGDALLAPDFGFQMQAAKQGQRSFATGSPSFAARPGFGIPHSWALARFLTMGRGLWRVCEAPHSRLSKAALGEAFNYPLLGPKRKPRMSAMGSGGFSKVQVLRASAQSTERLPQIVEDVFGVLKPNRQPQKAGRRH